MYTVSSLHIYPVKSLGGVSINAANLTKMGLEWDRRWMLVDAKGRFLSQRKYPKMALLKTEITEDGILVCDKYEATSTILIPFNFIHSTKIMVKVWDDVCEAALVSKEIDQWFTQKLQTQCQLVFMPENTIRKVDTQYAANNEITAFSDGYPILLIGEASLKYLNAKLAEPLPVNRFRPNIVVAGGLPHEEDEWDNFVIRNLHFYGVKLCARCVVTTIHQDLGIKGKEPLRTLATYRIKNNKIYFGQNLLHQGEGIIRVGDTLEIITRKENIFTS